MAARRRPPAFERSGREIEAIGIARPRTDGCMTSSPATSLTEQSLEAWGRSIGAVLAPPAVIVLRGDLGAGKTTLARAIARGAGVEGHIPSPTYNLLFRYPAFDGREVVHIDLYRLQMIDEVWALGWSELPGGADIVLIEWGERAEDLLPEPRWEIFLDEGDDPESRFVRLTKVGDPPPLPELPDFEV